MTATQNSTDRPSAFPDFRAAGAAQLEELVALRRELHRDPEIGLDLPRTQQRVLAALEGLDLEISTGTATTSVTAVLRGGRPGPVVLLRADMDALPVLEANDLPYRSPNEAMHACGHDLHTAGLVGAARLLADVRDELPGDVVFMFQPGEEGYHGARVMIEEGVLEAAGARPIAAFAAHVGTSELGLFRSKPGPVLAGSAEVRVALHGRGGHGSNPAAALDPVPALAEVVLALQSLATRTVPVHDPVVLTVTCLEAGNALNVIPEQASLAGTLRAFSAEMFAELTAGIERVAHGVAAAHGLTAEVQVDVQYPVTVTDPALTARMRELVEETFGKDHYDEIEQPIMGSEDFSYVLEQIPGCFVMVGARPPSVSAAETAYPHSPQVLFDDSVLGDQAAMLALLAWDRLNAG